MPRASLWLALLLLTGCARSRYVYSVDALPIVVQPAQPQWDLAVTLDLTDTIQVQVANESPQPVTIVWDESRYLDAAQQPHPLLGVRPLKHRQLGTLPPTVIQPGMRADVRVLPVPSLEPVGDPYLSSSRMTKKRLERSGILGRSVGVLLVFERSGGERKTALARYQIVSTKKQ